MLQHLMPARCSASCWPDSAGRTPAAVGFQDRYSACPISAYPFHRDTAMKARQSLALVKQAASAWVGDRAPSMGAALSYYTGFSIAPLLLIVIAVAGLVFGADA